MGILSTIFGPKYREGQNVVYFDGEGNNYEMHIEVVDVRKRFFGLVQDVFYSGRLFSLNSLEGQMNEINLPESVISGTSEEMMNSRSIRFIYARLQQLGW